MKMKDALPSLRDAQPFEVNEKLTADMQAWGLNVGDFAGRAHAIRGALQSQKRTLGRSRGFDHVDRLPDAWLSRSSRTLLRCNAANRIRPIPTRASTNIGEWH